MTKYILVSGGAGFIGINLVKKLAEDSNNLVVVLDNFISSSKETALQAFRNITNVKLYKFDINNLEDYGWVYPRIDEIYHLASIASPKYYNMYPLETLDVGYLGTKNLLDLSRYYKAKILLTSTSEVYGNPTISPQHEGYYGNVNCYGNRSQYDESKRIAETLFYNYKKLYNVDTRIARIFNTYGPYMSIDDGRIIPAVMKALIDKTPLNIFGDGSQTRCFCYVDDTVDGLIKLMSSCYYEGPVNIGDSTEITINQLVDITENAFGKTLETAHTEIDIDDPRIRQPDLTLANEVLGWSPTTDLSDGLKKTLEYFQSTLDSQ